MTGYGQDVQEENDESFHHCLMEENSLSLGLGSLYSFGLESVGVHSRIYYNHGEQFCFGPEFSFVKNPHEEIMDFDLVAHYIFETPWFGLFPLGGINYTIEKKTDTEKEWGLIYGAGIHRNVKRFTFFAEYSRVAGPLSDQFLTSGLMYRFQF